ncbi:MAG: hypothetical protein ACRDL8_19310 [Solirubrobacteraceae bacterium]
MLVPSVSATATRPPRIGEPATEPAGREEPVRRKLAEIDEP